MAMIEEPHERVPLRQLVERRAWLGGFVFALFVVIAGLGASQANLARNLDRSRAELAASRRQLAKLTRLRVEDHEEIARLRAGIDDLVAQVRAAGLRPAFTAPPSTSTTSAPRRSATTTTARPRPASTTSSTAPPSTTTTLCRVRTPVGCVN